MTDYDFEGVVGFCRDTVGESVRAAVVVEQTDHETLYVRPDIREQYRDRPGSLTALVSGGRDLQSILARVDTDDTTLGVPEAAVVTFEHAVLIQFVTDDSTSLAVSFDRDVGRDLVDFIADCLTRLE